MSKVLNNYIQSLENKLARLRNPETTEEEFQTLLRENLE